MTTNRNNTTHLHLVEATTPALSESRKARSHREAEYRANRNSRRCAHAQREEDARRNMAGKMILAVLFILGITWVLVVTFCQAQSWQNHKAHQTEEANVQMDKGQSEAQVEAERFFAEHPEMFGSEVG